MEGNKMGINTNSECVVKDWVWKLSWKQQAALLSSLRGCDSVDKYDPSKKFIRKMRNALLHNGAVEGAEFLTSSISNQDISMILQNLWTNIPFTLYFIISIPQKLLDITTQILKNANGGLIFTKNLFMHSI